MADDREIGAISLQQTTRLVFLISRWQGREYAHVRKFVSANKYEGATKSGLTMVAHVLGGVIEALRRLETEIPTTESVEFARVSKRGQVDVVITIVPPDDIHSLPLVDIREYIDTPRYSGPTKKGVRFPWDRLPQVIALLETLADHLETSDPPQFALFPQTAGRKPKPLTGETDEPHGGRDAVVAKFLPNGPRAFPEDFLEGKPCKTRKVELPEEPIELAQQPDGQYVVRSSFGYCHPVRNIAEGNFLSYAFLRRERTVHVPEQMVVVFKAVKAYENYLRDLRQSLIRELERKSGHRPVAEHQAKEVFRSFGLPWIEQP